MECVYNQFHAQYQAPKNPSYQILISQGILQEMKITRNQAIRNNSQPEHLAA